MNTGDTVAFLKEASLMEKNRQIYSQRQYYTAWAKRARVRHNKGTTLRERASSLKEVKSKLNL